jgi:protein SCO1/2
MTDRRFMATLACLAALLTAVPSVAQNFYEGLPAPLQRVSFDQRLGELVDLSLIFNDEKGDQVRLGELIGDRPVALVLVYHGCPMLCSMSTNGLVTSLKALEMTPGDEFDVLVVSFDPEDTPELARNAKTKLLTDYARPGSESGWHFLTGEQESIDALTEAVGFHYTRDEETGEFAHAAGLTILTPEGTISRYLYGIEYPARSLRLALIESAEGQIGNLVDQAILFCYRYDPATGTYSATTMNVVRLAGALTVLAIVVLLFRTVRRERRGRPAHGEPSHVA